MIFLTFLCNRLWIIRFFILLSVVNHSGAQGDPTRIPTADELVGLIYQSNFKRWPVCVTDCGLQAALNSSIEEWCTMTFIGACMQKATFVRISKFCSLVGSSPCPTNQCIYPPEPKTLVSWVNTACNLTAGAQVLWNQSTSEREQAFRALIPLDEIGSRPSCSDACPRLVDGFRSATMPASLLNTTQFCAGLVDIDGCREACTFGNDPRKLFSWVNSTCGDKAYGRKSWREVTEAKEVAWVFQWIPALFPWNWTVQALDQPATLATIGIQITDPIISSKPYLSLPSSGPGACKTSTTEKLGVFAAVNIVSAFLLPILGRRTVVKKLTFGYFGNLGSRWWPLMGVLSALLNIFANLLNAYVIRSTPGYENVPLGALALLWCTRPRLAWLAVFLAAIEPEEGMYFNSAAAAITSEAILQVLGAVYFGISANYARKKRFYYVGHLDPYPRGVDAHVMYAGALLWLMMSFITVFSCIVCIVGLSEVIANARKMMEGLQNAAAATGNAVVVGPFQRWVDGPLGRWLPEWFRHIFDKEQDETVKAEPRRLTAAEIKQIESIVNAGIIFGSFLAQWLFWAGFVKAAQERYCPPKLAVLGAIWSLFSASGTFVGSAH